MARKKERPTIHPGAAIAALGRFHDDVGFLCATVTSVASVLADPALLKGEAGRIAMAERLQAAVAKVNRHWADDETTV